jgi:hypothetical protein
MAVRFTLAALATALCRRRERKGDERMEDASAAQRRADEIETELAELTAKFERLNRPTLLERVDPNGVGAADARDRRIAHRAEVEKRAKVLYQEHEGLCNRYKAISPLGVDSSIQVAALRVRLRAEQATAGRYKVLVASASTRERSVRLQKLADAQNRVEYLSRLISRLERAAGGSA